MIVYSATKQGFLRDNNDREIDEVIRGRFLAATGNRVTANEERSWQQSLGYMAKVIADDAIPNAAGFAIEYHIPQSAKRLDILVEPSSSRGGLG